MTKPRFGVKLSKHRFLKAFGLRGFRAHLPIAWQLPTCCIIWELLSWAMRSIHRRLMRLLMLLSCVAQLASTVEDGLITMPGLLWILACALLKSLWEEIPV